jgi:hypothetical protein
VNEYTGAFGSEHSPNVPFHVPPQLVHVSELEIKEKSEQRLLGVNVYATGVKVYVVGVNE